MNLNELLNIIDGKILDEEFIKNKIKGISINTRSIKQNEISIALKGKNYDGHSFIREAIEKKCSCIIIDNADYLIDTKIPIIKVSNTYDTLIKLGTYYRNKYIKLPLIAITGSVGKTTTKDLI